MTTELFYLACTALLTSALWVPVVVGYVRSRGALTAQEYRVAPTSPLPDWVNRAHRAHANAVENFAPFAAVVLVSQAIGLHTALTAACTAVFFYARLAHAVVHVSGFGKFRARTLLFTVAWAAFATLAVALLWRSRSGV